MRCCRPSALAVLCTVAACGGDGGGADDFLYPLWVPTDVAVSDVDRDGLREILTLAQLATSADRREGRLIVHRRTSPGTYVTTQTVGFGLYPWRLATGDLDGDGRNEIVVLAGEDRYLVVQT